MHRVVEIIKECEPVNMDNSSNQEEIEIDFEKLNTRTLRKLEKFVAESLKGKPTSRVT